MSANFEKIFETAVMAQRRVSNLSIRSRLERVRELANLILSERERIIDSIQSDTGKSRTDALMSEIFPVLDHLDYLVRNASEHLKERRVSTPLFLAGKQSYVLFEPLGVILVISPWNYPFYQAIVPISTAYVAGNAVLYKPSEHTPLRGLLEDLLERAGFDESDIQIVYGDGAVGRSLIAHRPDKIFFTGGAETGKVIMKQAAEQLTPLELELGGKDPMIVFEDVQLERAVAGATWGAFTHSGQSCTSVERLYIHYSIYESFKELFVKSVESMNQEVDTDGSSDIGKMTTPFQVKTVSEHLEDALEKGAKQLSGFGWDRRSDLIPPIVLENVTSDMKVYQDETFGPIVSLFPFKTEKGVVGHANDTEYGLSASVWTQDDKRAKRVARALKTGNVSINNVMLSEGNHALPFGGVKKSGFGRFKGEWGLHSFSNIKALLIDKNSKKIEANWYPYTTEKYRLFSEMMLGLFKRGLKGILRFARYGLKLEIYSSKIWRKRNFTK